jgi:hypothetical protein
VESPESPPTEPTTVPSPPGSSYYVVVAGANSAARFDDVPQPATVRDFPTTVGPADLTFRTRYSEEGHEAAVPRELWVDIRGHATCGLDEAINAYVSAAHALLGFVAVSANAAIQDPDVKLAFDNTADRDRRLFFQQFVPEFRGAPLPGRRVDSEATVILMKSFDGHAEFDRLIRAVEQYRLALLEWRPGREILALAHLWMGMEALTKVALRRELAREGVTQAQELADAWGIDLRALDGEVRRRVLFRGDASTAKKAKEASDGFEHGFLPYAVIRPLAQEARDLTATYLREAIFDLSDVPEMTARTLLGPEFASPIHPWVVRYMRGEFIGETDDLAAPDQEYPIFTWSSKLKSHRKADGGGFELELDEEMTARFNERVRFQRNSFEVWGSKEGFIRMDFTKEPECTPSRCNLRTTRRIRNPRCTRPCGFLANRKARDRATRTGRSGSPRFTTAGTAVAVLLPERPRDDLEALLNLAGPRIPRLSRDWGTRGSRSSATAWVHTM